MNDSPYSLKKPCKNCPFNKTGAIELHPGRVESILQDLLNGKTTGFQCHKTAYRAKSSERVRGKEKECAGALIVLEKLERQTQLMQVMDRLGFYKPADLLPYHDQVINAPRLELESHYRIKAVILDSTESAVDA